MTCPNADILTRFADATLADHEAADVVEHLAVCEACSRKVEDLEHRSEQPMMAALRDLKNAPTEIDDSPLPKKIAQYDILERIGQGGMGVVYRAVHPHLKREVALKVIRDTRLDDPTTRERFVQEMQSLGRLSHPNIVHATDAGIDGDVPFIVTELLDGQDLGSYIEEHGKMSVNLAVDCIRQAATGLAYAHKAGYVHRDIKPSNLFLLRDGNVKILDLGIARPLADSAGEGQTQKGHVVGSPEFMAPEQFRGGTADARSDIYSLGQTFANLLHEPISSTLKPILARMTAGLPDQRYQTADELIRALDSVTKNSRIKYWMAATLVVSLAVVGFMLIPSTDIPVVEPLPTSSREPVVAETKIEPHLTTPTIIVSRPEPLDEKPPAPQWITAKHETDFSPPYFDITSPTGWDKFFSAINHCYWTNGTYGLRDDHFTAFCLLYRMGRDADADQLALILHSRSRPRDEPVSQLQQRILELKEVISWEDAVGNKEKSDECQAKIDETHAQIKELIAAETSDLKRDRLNISYDKFSVSYEVRRKKSRTPIDHIVPKELVDVIEQGEPSIKDFCDNGQYREAIYRYLKIVQDSYDIRKLVQGLYKGYGESYVVSRMVEKGDLEGAEKVRQEVGCSPSMRFRMGCSLVLGHLKAGRKDEARAVWNDSFEKLTAYINRPATDKVKHLNALLESLDDTGLYEYVQSIY